MLACWTVKGGSGTTVFASALALGLAERHGAANIVDLSGDVPAVLGMAEPANRGVRDWLAGIHRDPQDFVRLRLAAAPRLGVVPAGSDAPFDDHSLIDLANVVADHTVVDFGTLQPPESLRPLIRSDWLVLRPCYLALRRAARLPRRPTGVIVVREPGRALTSRDIQSVVGAPVVGEVSVTGEVARSVDAGLLATRLPRLLADEIGALL
jgi:hypothetical protein